MHKSKRERSLEILRRVAEEFEVSFTPKPEPAQSDDRMGLLTQPSPTPSDIVVGYLTLIRRDGSKEHIEITNLTKLRMDPAKGNDQTKIKIIADTEIEHTPAPPMPKTVYELSSRHEGLHLNYGLINGRIDRISTVETSSGIDNWDVCAIHATIGGRDHIFNDNDPITVTRYI